MDDLKGKVAIVTGAAKGIGAAIAGSWRIAAPPWSLTTFRARALPIRWSATFCAEAARPWRSKQMPARPPT
jgi:NAD(P)-dependent dehydrogenase (short-subunit alcohol dehydrogenase family)